MMRCLVLSLVVAVVGSFVLFRSSSSTVQPRLTRVCGTPEEEDRETRRRSRLYRIEAQVAALEKDPGSSSETVSKKLESLLSSDGLGEAARERVLKLEARVKKAKKEAKSSSAVDEPRKQKKKKKGIEEGDLVQGIVVALRPFGAMVALDGRRKTKPSLLHISEISNARVDSIGDVLPVGSRITCVVASIDDEKRISLSTKRLESSKGAMLRDREAVFRNAAKTLASLDATESSYEGKTFDDVTTRTAKLADSVSLDDLDALVSQIKMKEEQKKQRAAARSSSKSEEKAEDAPSSALSIAAAFQPKPLEKAREQEFELLMRDVIYEPSSSLTDVAKLLRGRGKRGAFTSPFWTKIFKRDMPGEDETSSNT